MVIDRHIVRKRLQPGRWIPGLLMVFLLMSQADLSAQRSPFDSIWISEASQIREEVDCFTDRSFYMVEELIQFRARVTQSGPTGPGSWSTVLYVELVSADGKRLAWGKFPIYKNVATGEIRIPANLLSGQYYLRSYSHWMRNWGPESFTYLPLRIINPQRTELYPSSSTETRKQLPSLRGNFGHSLELIKAGSSFARGDSVELDILFAGSPDADSLEGCFTIVPLGLLPSSMQYSEQVSRENFRLDFLPDRFGPSLSGAVQFQDGSTEGLSSTVVHFTLMGENAGYFVSRSDALGKFSLGLPMRSGKMEIFVQPEGPDNKAVEVRIDQDFDPRHIHFQNSTITLTDEEIKWAAIMARNVQLSEIYGQVDTLLIPDSAKELSAFYGAPSFSVDLDEYVLLPTLREVFLNLVPSVTPTSRKGKSSLLIESVNPSLSLYETLVMVDQVPVLDMERFMSMSPARIKQIDVIEDVYVKGDLRFGGVINLHSRDKDMAGIDLPDNSFFIDYMALQPGHIPRDYPIGPDDQIPDIRNTFLWLPECRLIKGSPSRISFKAPDYPGEYVVLFRGRNEKGELIRAESTFVVP